MKTIHSFTLVPTAASAPGSPATEATLLQVSAGRSGREWDFASPTHPKATGLSPLQSKEVSVRVRSALNAIGHDVGGIDVRIDAHGATLIASALDLPIAIALLADVAPSFTSDLDLDGLAIAGELGLDGSVRPVRGILAFVEAAKAAGFKRVLVPLANVREALEVDGIAVFGVHNLAHLETSLSQPFHKIPESKNAGHFPDFSDVRGQDAAVAAIVEAVGARRDVLLVGAPGTGKTMLARRIPGILPSPTHAESVAVTKAYSALGLVSSGLIAERPFRAPHHTISAAALVGGGASGPKRPGEVQLAAYGVLMLDEVVEFSRAALESLRGALDALGDARPMLIACANSYPYSWFGSPVRACTCPASSVARWDARLESTKKMLGLTNAVEIDVASVPAEDLRALAPSESSAELRARVCALRAGLVGRVGGGS